MDNVGPRYLKNDGRFYAINLIDAYDRRVRVNPNRRQNKDAIVVGMLRSWGYLGLPEFLQMDNTLSTQGSHRHPHSFGLVIRLCLHLGIQPIFIPIREPWRNAFIERFNDDFDNDFSDRSFLRTLNIFAARRYRVQELSATLRKIAILSTCKNNTYS